MVWISDKQRLAMGLVDELVDELGGDRLFMQSELRGITKHTMDALVDKEYLARKVACGNVYYRRLKMMEVAQ